MVETWAYDREAWAVPPPPSLHNKITKIGHLSPFSSICPRIFRQSSFFMPTKKIAHQISERGNCPRFSFRNSFCKHPRPPLKSHNHSLFTLYSLIKILVMLHADISQSFLCIQFPIVWYYGMSYHLKSNWSNLVHLSIYREFYLLFGLCLNVLNVFIFRKKWRKKNK